MEQCRRGEARRRQNPGSFATQGIKWGDQGHQPTPVPLFRQKRILDAGVIPSVFFAVDLVRVAGGASAEAASQRCHGGPRTEPRAGPAPHFSRSHHVEAVRCQVAAHGAGGGPPALAATVPGGRPRGAVVGTAVPRHPLRPGLSGNPRNPKGMGGYRGGNILHIIRFFGQKCACFAGGFAHI